jgi:anti-sigma factor RsiW
MTCRELVELVSDYLEGRLDARDQERFTAHLDVCPDCREYVEQMRVTVRALGEQPAERLSPAARSTLMRAFRDWPE